MNPHPSQWYDPFRRIVENHPNQLRGQPIKLQLRSISRWRASKLLLANFQTFWVWRIVHAAISEKILISDLGERRASLFLVTQYNTYHLTLDKGDVPGGVKKDSSSFSWKDGRRITTDLYK